MSINGLVTDMFGGYLPFILEGMLWTIALSVASLIGGLILGILFAMGELHPLKRISVPVLGVTGVLRGLPEIVVLFFCYFGGTIILTHLFKHYVGINSFSAGVFSLALIFGAYASQVFRGAFYQIPQGQFDARDALGFSKKKGFINIILPQMLHHARPGLSNLWLILLKDSSLVSLIGLGEMMNNIGLAASNTHEPFVFYSLAAILYLGLTSGSRFLFERKSSWS